MVASDAFFPFRDGVDEAAKVYGPHGEVSEPGAGAGALVRVALCFSGTEVGLFTRPFTLEGVLVTWPRAFARVLGAAGALGPVERRVLAARIARAFPPYAPGGTSHRPTGASPRR